MITLLHGDHIEASRAQLHRLKESLQSKEIRVLDGKDIDTALLTQALESTSLFGGDTAVIIERLFGKLGKKAKLIESLAHILVSAANSTDIILWEDKELGVTALKALGKIDVKLFKTPTIIFQFLDGLAPNNAKDLLPLYSQLTTNDAPELVFSMIVRRLRQLIQIHDGITPVGLQGWQAGRLTRQAKLFTMDKLVSLYRKLLEIEYSTKNGTSAFALRELTEQFIIDL